LRTCRRHFAIAGYRIDEAITKVIVVDEIERDATQNAGRGSGRHIRLVASR